MDNITYPSKGALDAVDEEKLRIFYWGELSGVWKLVKDSGVDTRLGMMYANVTHLTIFALREHDDITPPGIVHKAVKRADPDKVITITATITDEGNGVSMATLYYRRQGDSIYDIKTMKADGDRYSAEIPSHEVKKDQVIEYYIRASDGTNTATHPGDTDKPHRIEIREADEGGFIPGFGIVIFLGSIMVSFITYSTRPERWEL